MTDMLTIEEQIVSIIREFGQVDCDIPLESDIYSEVGVESVNSIAILFGMEEKFACTIDDRDFIQARSVTALTQLIKNLKAGAV